MFYNQPNGSLVCTRLQIFFPLAQLMSSSIRYNHINISWRNCCLCAALFPTFHNLTVACLCQSYFIAETTMPGKRGFDFNGSGQAFNVLAAYLFGKNTASEQMEMTTPVFTRKAQSDGERMEMTTPVITNKLRDEDSWQMSFVMPSKYGGNLPTPRDPSVRIRELPRKIVAVAAFSGFVTDEMVKDKELRLRDALRGDLEFQAKENTLVEVAQFNPPFTLPFTRRNEVSLEVEKRHK
ncbi:hypothetical protein Taro_029131 [Colocasia esculenta]|uniref:SOUL heme-binding protein n=1 Tax=Colocasia esculenta TaxID=4460 RepID=A0A843VN65_COLES|nr:hypothetical protein [Colocasia esculenta]